MPIMWKLIIPLILLSSCSVEKRIQRHFNKLEKLGVSFKNDTIRDTTIVEHTLYDSAVIVVDDTVVIDSLIDVKAPASVVIKEVLKNVAISPLLIDSGGVEGKIWVDNGMIKYNLTAKEKTIKEQVNTNPVITPKKSWWARLNLPYIAVILLLAGIIIAKK